DPACLREVFPGGQPAFRIVEGVGARVGDREEHRRSAWRHYQLREHSRWGHDIQHSDANELSSTQLGYATRAGRGGLSPRIMRLAIARRVTPVALIVMAGCVSGHGGSLAATAGRDWPNTLAQAEVAAKDHRYADADRM